MTKLWPLTVLNMRIEFRPSQKQHFVTLFKIIETCVFRMFFFYYLQFALLKL